MFDWEALVSASFITLVIQALAIFVLRRVLNRIGLKSENTAISANQVSEKVELVLDNNKTMNKTLKDVKQMLDENVEVDAEFYKIYEKASVIITKKVELLNALKSEVDEYIHEE